MSIIEMPPQEPDKPKRITATNKRGNGKSLNEIAARAERSVARIEAERQTNAALAVAEELRRTAELRTQARAMKLENYVKQEQSRAPQFQIDQRVTLYLLIALAAIMFIATAILSADGTIGAASSALFAVPWFGYVLFGAVEISILVFLLVYYVKGSRIDYEGNPEVAVQWFVAMIVMSAVSVGLSAYHVIDAYRFDWSSVQMYVGIGIRLAVTLGFVFVSKAIAGVLFAKAVHL
jgi:hypothetical protein